MQTFKESLVLFNVKTFVLRKPKNPTFVFIWNNPRKQSNKTGNIKNSP